MNYRQVIRVLPGNRGWRVANSWHRRKSDAITWGKNVAKSFVVHGGLAQLVIHKKDGTIEREFTYGKDPKRRKG